MIELLNGEIYNREDLLSKMHDDNFYYGFLGKNALSSSSCKSILTSPNEYARSISGDSSKKESTALRDGRLIHMAILEPDKMEKLIVSEGSARTNEYKGLVEEHGYHNVITKQEFNKANQIALSLMKNKPGFGEIEDYDYEVQEIGTYDGLPFRGKADCLSKDRRFIVDIKTTSDTPSKFYNSAKWYNYSVQAALYLHLFGAEMFSYIVINKTTGDLGVFDVSDEFIYKGHDLLKESCGIYREEIKGKSIEELSNYVTRGTL